MDKSRLLAAATATSILVTTWAVTGPDAVGATTRARPVKAAPVIAWRPCADPVLKQANAECGYLAVPMDYAHPSGRQIRLAISRVKHTTPTSQGVMLTNPGGPGGSGLQLSVLGSRMPGNSGAEYDWIGYDPRGVGSSKPALSCRPQYFHANRPAYVPVKQSDVQRWLNRSRDYARGCAKYGALLAHMKTTDNVRDMDRIRQALGAKQINFYGWSYGTYLGQVYATLFPSHVRRMVLDSNVDPRRVWYQANLDQNVALEPVFGVFFRWVARHHASYHLGRTGRAVKRLYFKEQNALRRTPAGGVLGPSEWNDAFVPAGYAQFFWPTVAQGFAAWVHRHDAKPLISVWRAYDTPGNDNTFAVYLATECTDARWPTQWSRWEADARRLNRTSPMFTWGNTWFNAPCLYWPAKPGTPVTVNGHGVHALLVDQTLDALTPFEGSLEVRSRFPGSRLVAIRGGTSHGTSPELSGQCANNRIAAFLKTGALPARHPGRRADVSCPAPPQPTP